MSLYKLRFVKKLQFIIEAAAAILACIFGVKYIVEKLMPYISDVVYTERPLFKANQGLAVVAIVDIACLLLVIVLFNFLIGKFFKRVGIKRKIILLRNYKNLTFGINGITICWLFLYIWLFIFWWDFGIASHSNNLYSFVWAIADIFHAMTAFFFYYCYLVLEFPKNRRFANNRLFYKKLLITFGTMIFCLTLSIMGRFFNNALDKIGPMMLSFWVGLSMQFLFGRLNDRKLGFDSFLIIPLYLYVLLQVTWAALANVISDGGLLIIYILALVLKIYFYFFLFLLVTKHWERLESILKENIELQNSNVAITKVVKKRETKKQKKDS